MYIHVDACTCLKCNSEFVGAETYTCVSGMIVHCIIYILILIAPSLYSFPIHNPVLFIVLYCCVPPAACSHS